MRESPRVWNDTAGLPPFRRDRAEAHGLTDAAVRRALRAGDLVPTRGGVLVGRRRLELANDPRDQHLLQAQVSLAGLRGGSPPALCLGSAAAVHQISRLGISSRARRVRLYRERGGPWRDDCTAVLVCTLPGEHVTQVDGLPVTTTARTAADLSRWVSFRSAVVVMDSALHAGCSPEDLKQVLTRCKGWPGIVKARRAAAFADPGAATPLESISRVVFHESGLPAPELQVALAFDAHGNPRIVVDFLWRDYRVVGEADGLLKYDPERPDALIAEKLRQEEIEGLDYIVVRWTWDDIWRRPEWVVRRLREAFDRAARSPRRTA